MSPKAPASQSTFSPKKKGDAWPRRRRSGLQPWKRGRVRPSSCHDLKDKEKE